MRTAEGSAPPVRSFFFVTGLPRSRTAWLANLLSYGESFCFHDLFSTAMSMEAFEGKMRAAEFRFVGHSDPSNALLQDSIAQKFPEAKWLIVERPIDEVHASCRAIGVDDMGALERVQRKVEELQGKVDAWTLPASSLNDEYHVREVIEFLTPGAKVPGERVEMLMALQVQTYAPAALAKMESLRGTMGLRPEAPRLTEANARYLALLRRLCAPEPRAASWFLSVLELATVWDHCIDGDGIDPAMADRALAAVSMEWPLNDWFVSHRQRLVPTLVSARDAWIYSNRATAPKADAYRLYTELPAVIAWLLGRGLEGAQIVAAMRECAACMLAEDEERDGGRK